MFDLTAGVYVNFYNIPGIHKPRFPAGTQRQVCHKKTQLFFLEENTGTILLVGPYFALTKSPPTSFFSPGIIFYDRKTSTTGEVDTLTR